MHCPNIFCSHYYYDYFKINSFKLIEDPMRAASIIKGITYNYKFYKKNSMACTCVSLINYLTYYMHIKFILLFLSVSRVLFLISCIMKQSEVFPGHRMKCCLFQAHLWYSSVHVIRELFIKVFPRDLSTIIPFGIFYICISAYEFQRKLLYKIQTTIP